MSAHQTLAGIVRYLKRSVCFAFVTRTSFAHSVSLFLLTFLLFWSAHIVQSAPEGGVLQVVASPPLPESSSRFAPQLSPGSVTELSPSSPYTLFQLDVVTNFDSAEPVGGEAQDHSESASSKSTVPALAELTSTRFAIGDKLEIKLFEQLATNDKAESVGVGALSALIERSELSGTYVVQQDGAITLPLLGTFNVLGASQPELIESMRRRFSDAFGSNIAVSLRTVAREPVYVVGDIPQPGAFQYTPGMLVLQAVALSGARTNRNGDERWRQFEYSNAREALEKSKERMKSLLARMSVLLASRDGRAPAPLPTLMDLVGEAHAEQFVIEASRLKETERKKLEGEEATADAVVQVLENERDVLKGSMAQADEAVKESSTRLKTLLDASKGGLIAGSTVDLARGYLSQTLMHWHNVSSSMAQVEESLATAARKKDDLVLTAKLEEEKELATAAAAVKEEQVTQATIGQLLLQPGMAMLSSESSGARYRILRPTASGRQELSANELTELSPGDVLQILRKPYTRYLSSQ
jgi:polysaccharide biosynthesis/export protein ExoF